MRSISTEQALAEIRGRREIEWKKKYCREHKLYRREGCVNVEDIRCAPEPADADLGWSNESLTVQWETGYLTVELAALAKLPAAQRNKIYKLGGLK